jgi:DNA-binding XRE family transcriptional regulator
MTRLSLNGEEANMVEDKLRPKSDFIIFKHGDLQIFVHDEGGEEIYYKVENGKIDILTNRHIGKGNTDKPDNLAYSYPDNAEWAIADNTAPSPEKLRALLKEKGLTGSQAAKIAGVNPRTIRKWVGGERGIPTAAWRLLNIHGKKSD